MELQPLGNRVVVKVLEAEEETTAGGIVIPESAKEKPQQADVVSVGPGEKKDGELVSPDVEEGDRIIFGKYSGSEVEVKGAEFLILNGDDILAKVG